MIIVGKDARDPPSTCCCCCLCCGCFMPGIFFFRSSVRKKSCGPRQGTRTTTTPINLPQAQPKHPPRRNEKNPAPLRPRARVVPVPLLKKEAVRKGAEQGMWEMRKPTGLWGVRGRRGKTGRNARRRRRRWAGVSLGLSD